MNRRPGVIVTTFIISFIAMVALSLFSMERFITYTEYSDQVNHTNLVIKKILKTQLDIRDIDRAERGYMVTRDTMYIRFLNNAIDSVQSMITEMRGFIKNPRQQDNLTLFKSSAALRIAAARSNIAYIDSVGNSTPSRFYFESRQLMIECSGRLNGMLDFQNTSLEERSRNEQFYQNLTTKTLINLLVVFCVITFILFFMMIKELRERVRYQRELQSKVIDLERSHSELKEIAYAASHDLQEPLRKIQVFSDMLSYKRKDYSDEEYSATLSKINSSAGRMQNLISDLMSLTSLIKIEELKKPVELNRMLQFILIDIEEKVQEKGATVEVQSLPEIQGYENQMKILFKALLDNSLKFTREGVRPEVVINCEIRTGAELLEINPNLEQKKFYCICCSDNGIGFENKYISKIFRIFQRLHNEDSNYEGKGIGLAICQRIMANHEGYIIANGTPGAGAEFKLFFPVEEA
jgi:signal transduction histidine kinase